MARQKMGAAPGRTLRGFFCRRLMNLLATGLLSNAALFAQSTFSNASLDGDYTFYIVGTDSAGPFVTAGLFHANGGGGISGGIMDRSRATGVSSNVSFSGAYLIGSDGRGTLSLSSALGPSTLRIVMLSESESLVIRFNSDATGSGALLRRQQDLSVASFNGEYVFLFAGALSGLRLDGVGVAHADGSGNISGAVEDLNQGGFLFPDLPFTGTYSFSPNGRGTATVNSTLGTNRSTVYAISPDAAIFLNVDAGSTALATAIRRGGPTLFSRGTVNGASFATGTAVAPGSIASVFGLNLARVSAANAETLPLPNTLGGARLQFDGNAAAPLFFASPTQINFQIPWELQGQGEASVVATVDELTSSIQVVPLATVAPGIFSMEQTGRGQGVIVIANTDSIAAPVGAFPVSRPVNRGEFVTIYCTGLGPVDNQPQTGSVALANPLSATVTTPVVTIGGIPSPVSFSGLTPGFVGLYQVNAEVPGNTPTGNAVPVVLSIGGVTSNTVTIAVQ